MVEAGVLRYMLEILTKSDRSGAHVIANGRKGDVCNQVTNNLANYSLVFCERKNLQVMKWDVELRKFLSKVLKDWFGFS
jgi:hypothetical protein